MCVSSISSTRRKASTCVVICDSIESLRKYIAGARAQRRPLSGIRKAGWLEALMIRNFQGG